MIFDKTGTLTVGKPEVAADLASGADVPPANATNCAEATAPRALARNSTHPDQPGDCQNFGGDN